MGLELDLLLLGQAQHLLDLDTHLTQLVGHLRGLGPHVESDSGLSNVDKDSVHVGRRVVDVVVLALVLGNLLVGLQRLADDGQHGVQPNLVKLVGGLGLELVEPLASGLVGVTLPLGSDALSEKCIVGPDGQLHQLGDVVVHSPEALDGVERHDLLDQIVPGHRGGRGLDVPQSPGGGQLVDGGKLRLGVEHGAEGLGGGDGNLLLGLLHGGGVHGGLLLDVEVGDGFGHVVSSSGHSGLAREKKKCGTVRTYVWA